MDIGIAFVFGAILYIVIGLFVSYQIGRDSPWYFYNKNPDIEEYISIGGFTLCWPIIVALMIFGALGWFFHTLFHLIRDFIHG